MGLHENTRVLTLMARLACSEKHMEHTRPAAVRVSVSARLLACSEKHMERTRPAATNCSCRSPLTSPPSATPLSDDDSGSAMRSGHWSCVRPPPPPSPPGSIETSAATRNSTRAHSGPSL